MRRLSCLALLLVLPLALAGCGGSASLENRAYALLLGVDRTATGGVTLTVCVPRVGASDDKAAGGEGDSPYLTYSAGGSSVAAALENLAWAVPRALSLSHILLVALSEEAARADGGMILDALMETRSLYAAARVVVCAGSAGEYVRGQAPRLEPRLSSELTTALKRSAGLGMSADATLADLYYAAHAPYGDAVAAWCGGKPEDGEGQMSPILIPEAGAIGEAQGTPPCLGSALFREGRMVLRLSARESLCMNLILGKAKAVTLDLEGVPVPLTLIRARRGADGDGLTVSLTLSCPESLSPERAARLEERLARAVLAAIHHCQRAGVEPFGFSESDARRFHTFDAWAASRWRERYAEAKVTARVKVRARQTNDHRE